MRFSNRMKPILPALLLSLVGLRAMGAGQPNILLIMADDLGAENLACYGNSVYSTPHLDRMAAEGARFEKSVVQPKAAVRKV